MEHARTAVPNQQQLDEVVVVAPRPRRRRRRHGPRSRSRLRRSFFSRGGSLARLPRRDGRRSKQATAEQRGGERRGVSSQSRPAVGGNQGQGGVDRAGRVLYSGRVSLYASRAARHRRNSCVGGGWWDWECTCTTCLCPWFSAVSELPNSGRGSKHMMIDRVAITCFSPDTDNLNCTVIKLLIICATRG